MCGRFTNQSDPAQLQLEFNLEEVPAEVQPSYNIAPTQEILAVVRRDGQNVLEGMRWGLIPQWAQDPNIGARMINARAESVAEKPSFKRPLKSQRCLIVADGFYEWHQVGAQKIPMFIRLKSRRPFGFAGLYDRWKSEEGKWITSCAILTTAANELMQPIHPRMPVILPKKDYKKWLDPANQDLDELVSLLRSYAPDKMVAYQVSPLVNSPRNNSPECIKPVVG